jgi:hypothetical protein
VVTLESLSRMKRPGRRRDSAGAQPPSTASDVRIQRLENSVSELTRQLCEERVRALVDLCIACGLITENERSHEEAKATKLSDDAIELIRRDLVKVVARISNQGSSHDIAGSGTNRQAPYVA